jgi:hypothetical protein
MRDDRGAAARRESRQPAIDSGASDGATAFFRRLRRFVGHGARRQTVRTAVVLLFLLVWMVFAAIAQQLALVEHVPAPTSDAIGSVKWPHHRLQPIASLIASVLILIMPSLLNYIVAAFLIISEVLGLGLPHWCATRQHVQQAEMAHDTRGDLELGDLCICDNVCAGFRLVDPDKRRIQRICGLGRGGGRNGGPRFALRLAQLPQFRLRERVISSA